MFSVGYAACLHSNGATTIMILPAKEGHNRQYFDTMRRNKIMTYVSTVKTRDEAIANVKVNVQGIRKTEDEKVRIMAALGIAIADAVSFASEQGYAACQDTLRDVVKTIVPRNEKNEPDNSHTQKLMGQSGDACKIAMLLLNAKTGFVAGYKRKDSRDYVDASTFAGMNKQAQDRHVAEIFWDRSQTFKKEKVGQDIRTSSTDTLIPSQDNMRDAYKVHFGNAEIDQGYKVKTASRPEGEGINSNADAKRHIAYLTAWIKDGNLLVADEKALKQYASLVETIQKGMAERINAESQTDELEKAA